MLWHNKERAFELKKVALKVTKGSEYTEGKLRTELTLRGWLQDEDLRELAIDESLPEWTRVLESEAPSTRLMVALTPRESSTVPPFVLWARDAFMVGKVRIFVSRKAADSKHPDQLELVAASPKERVVGEIEWVMGVEQELPLEAATYAGLHRCIGSTVDMEFRFRKAVESRFVDAYPHVSAAGKVVTYDPDGQQRIFTNAKQFAEELLGAMQADETPSDTLRRWLEERARFHDASIDLLMVQWLTGAGAAAEAAAL